MSSRRPDLQEHQRSLDALAQLGRDWASDNEEVFIGLLLAGIDALHAELNSMKIPGEVTEVERMLMAKLFKHVQSAWRLSSFISFFPHHELPEGASIPAGRGRPPSYDLCFVNYANDAVAWPIEGKVLAAPGKLSDYLDSISSRFLSGKYAPFSTSGAMLAFLTSGVLSEIFDEIESQSGISLNRQDPRCGCEISTSMHIRIQRLRETTPEGLKLYHVATNWRPI